MTTDRHIVSLPLEAEQASAVITMGGGMAFGAEENVDAFGRPRKPKTAWELRSVRRLDFGSPVSMIRDASSGLLFLTLKATEAAHDHRATAAAASPAGEANAGKKDKGGATASSSAAVAFADSIGIVAARHKVNRPDRLSLSAAQLYQDHPGSLQGICPCTPVGRVVTFDDSGCLVIWRLMRERANMLQASDSPPNAASVAALAGHASGMLMTLKDAPDTPMDMHNHPAMAKLSLDGDVDDQQAAAAAALVDVATAVLAKVTRGKKGSGAPAVPRPEKYQNKYERKARTLIKDFEIAVKEDPHVWSAGPCTLEGDGGFSASNDALNAWAPADVALMDVDGTGPKKAFGFSKMRIDRSVAERLDLVLQQEGGGESAAAGEVEDGAAADIVVDEMAFEEDPENPVSDEEEDDSEDDDEEEDEFMPVEEEAVMGLVSFPHALSLPCTSTI